MRGPRRLSVTLVLLITIVAALSGSLALTVKVPSARAALPGAPGAIAFVSTRDGNFEIYSREIGGSTETNLTNTPSIKEDDPAWSPDGSRIAFAAGIDVWVMDADGSDPVNLTPGGDTGTNGLAGIQPTWAPDASRIAYKDPNGEIWSVTPEGTDRTNLTQTPVSTALESEPSWSPDGSQIAYVRGGGDLWLMNDDGTNQHALIATTAAEKAPDWSPDGNLIVYQRGQEIWTVKPDGSGAKRIAVGPSTDAVWAPDAQHVLFSSSAFDAQNGPDLFVMGINGGGVTRIGGVANFTDDNPSWQPTVDSTDLAVSLSDTPDPVRVSDVVTYTATVSNNGPADARLVTVATGIPFGTTLGTVETTQGQCTERLASIVCRLGALAAGGDATVTIPVTVPNPFDISLGASLSSSQGDTDPSNDTDVELTSVKPPLTSLQTARLNWIVPDRLRDYDGDGLIDERKFNRPNLTPEPFEMTLMGCDSTPFGGITKYAFRVTLPNGDVLTQASSSCRFTFNPPREGIYPSKLTITTDEGTSTVEKDIPFRDFFIVSLGDSVASGEGNPDRHNTNPLFVFSNDVWQDVRCHRSASSGPSQAALQLETSDRQSSVTFAHLACSGGQVTKGILEPYLGIQPDGNLIPPQANVMRDLMDAWHRKPDAVLISVGANDAEFADAVLRCLLPDRCQNDPDFVSKVQTRLSRLPGRFDMLDEKLDALGIPGDKVWITEYFDPTRDDAGAFKQCLPTLYPSEWQWAEENVVAVMNERVQAAANLDQHGWHFVGGIANAFLRHGYCAGANWIVRLEQSLGGQGDQNGAFHPNETGQQEYMRRILDGLWRTLLLR